MIVAIQKGNYVKGIIEYHERKIEAGKGFLLSDNTLSENKTERISTFMDVRALNNRVRKNAILHISVSFNLEDRAINSDRMVQVGEEYLKRMDIENVPVLMYEHSDKRHQHFHIVTSSINFEGKKIPDFKDHERSQQLSRLLEKEFHLTPTVYETRAQRKLNELNAMQYRLVNGLKKSQSPDIPIDIELKNEIIERELSDKQVRDLVLERGMEEHTFFQLYRSLEQEGALFKTEKQKLIDLLTHIKSTSQNKEDFFSRLQQHGLYVRQIASGPGTYSLVYGNAQSNFYLKEKSMPIAFQNQYLFTDKVQEFNVESQRTFLTRMVRYAVKNSLTLEQFQEILETKGVRTHLATNSKGIYGISFSSSNIKSPQIFKASELDRSFSWNNLQKSFGHISKAAPAIEPTAPTTGSAPSTEKGIRAAGNIIREMFKENEDKKGEKDKNNPDREPE